MVRSLEDSLAHWCTLTSCDASAPRRCTSEPKTVLDCSLARRLARSLVHPDVVRRARSGGGAPVSRRPCSMVRSLEDSLAHWCTLVVVRRAPLSRRCTSEPKTVPDGSLARRLARSLVQLRERVTGGAHRVLGSRQTCVQREVGERRLDLRRCDRPLPTPARTWTASSPAAPSVVRIAMTASERSRRANSVRAHTSPYTHRCATRPTPPSTAGPSPDPSAASRSRSASDFGAAAARSPSSSTRQCQARAQLSSVRVLRACSFAFRWVSPAGSQWT